MIMTWPLKQHTSGSTTSKGSPINLEKIETLPFSVNQRVANVTQERTTSQAETDSRQADRQDSIKNKGSSYSDMIQGRNTTLQPISQGVSQQLTSAQKTSKEAREGNPSPLLVDEEDRSEPAPIECHIVSSSGVSIADKNLELDEKMMKDLQKQTRQAAYDAVTK